VGFLYLLEKIRMPWLNTFFQTVTVFGEETVLLVLAMIVFWCVDKRQGYYFLAVGFVGNIANQFLKLVFRVPRPWVRDSGFMAVESAMEGAGGYSFPSGHTQTAFGNFGAIAVNAKRRWVQAICVCLAVLVGFSRMYLGVHTPADVFVGALMAIAALAGLYPLMMRGSENKIPWVLGALILLSVAFAVYIHLANFSADDHNYQSGLKNAHTFLGCTVGLLVVWFADRKTNFRTNALWWAQLLKVGIGLVLVLAVKEGLRLPLELLFGNELFARSVRYFLMVVVAGALWPLAFRYFPNDESVE
jgi:membrane-associated phospholipid phosphatase